MIIYPAIDLKNGKCVRLIKGKMNESTIYNEDPVDQAKIFEKNGFKYLHLIDLDGAFAGKPINAQIVKEIINNINVPVQLGGGIRTIETIQNWLDIGVSRVILGTVAVKNPEIVIEACKKFPGKIIVGIDAKNGFVATEGWDDVSDIDAISLARKFENIGVSAIIYTNIDRDGTLEGVDAEGTQKLANAVNIPIIASGGVSSEEDINKLKDVHGVIVGKALYNGNIKGAK